MPNQLTIRGALRVDGQPVPGQDILVISRRLDAFLGATTTDANGEFSCTTAALADASEVALLAKVKGPVVTAVFEVVKVPQTAPVEIDVNSHARFFRIDGRIESSVGWPDHLNVFLDPDSIDGLADALGRYLNLKDHGVFDGHFIYTPVRGKTFTFVVAPGAYRIGGDFIVYERPMLANPGFQNVIVNEVTLGPGGDELPGNPYRGFSLKVDADVQVTLALRVVEDREL